MVFDSMTSMDILKINEKVKYFSAFVNTFKRDISLQYYDDIYHRTQSGKIDDNFCEFVSGDKGSCKSGKSLAKAAVFDPTGFDAERVFFSNQDLKDAMETSKPGQWFIRDETVKDFGTGTRQLESDIQMFVETLRKRRNCLIFIRPTMESIGGLDFYTLTFKGNMNWEHKHVGFSVLDPSTGGSKRCIGGAWIPLKHVWNSQLWHEYGKKKDEFLEKVVHSGTQESRILKDAEVILKHPGYKLCTKVKEIEILVKRLMAHSVTQHQKDVAVAVVQIQRVMDDNSLELREALEYFK